ncbi:hypothetical protein Trydic_g14208 [Trypoxylus dichotomus]
MVEITDTLPILFRFCLLPILMLRAVEYCESDLFPLVTDLTPDDCDNENNYYYRENGVNDCFPACLEAVESFGCGILMCPPGYYCVATRCSVNSSSCYRYYTKNVDEYTRAMWKPTCLPDESWAPKQCKGEAANGRCFCFDGEGNRLFGDAFSLDADDMTCACSRRRAELEKMGDSVFVSLHCDSMGNYEPLQCDMDSEQCWCVEPKTGDITSTIVPMGLMTRLSCYNETTVGNQYLRQCESELYAQAKIIDEFNAHGTERVNFDPLSCLYDGSYGPYKIQQGILYCVWRDRTNIGAYQVSVDSDIDSVNCNCARDTKVFAEAGLRFSLSCASNGNYKPIQMDGSRYYCVDDDGFPKSETMDDEPDCTKYVFPLVTDLAPSDCNNAKGYFYTENYVYDCFPACAQRNESHACDDTTALCPLGYYCTKEQTCALNQDSSFRYHTPKKEDFYASWWKPKYLPDGTWAPKQCQGEAANGRCFCFDAVGNRIFGHAFSLNAENMTCTCSRRRSEMEKAGNNVFVSLHCDDKGNYEPLQCDVDSQQCWCAEPKTGELTSHVVPMDLMPMLPCYNRDTVGSQYLRICESELYAQKRIADEFHAHGTATVNFPLHFCQYDGSFGPLRIDRGLAFCVWRDGSLLTFYQAADSSLPTVNCNCALDERIFSLAGLNFLLSCLGNGNYNSLQFTGTHYFCVDRNGFVATDPTIERQDCTKYA